MDARTVADDMTARVEERPLYIEHDGKRLFGILHVPAQRLHDLAVVFLSSGLQNRAGPHRIYVKAARRFGELGMMSLRLDLPGVGDSDELSLETHHDCHDYHSIPAATDVLTAKHGTTRVVLLGLCAGARVAVRAAARDPRVDAVVNWSLPIVSGPVNMPVAKGGGAYMGPTRARAQLREWAPKLVNPAAWYRYLTSEKTLVEGWDMMRRTLGGFLPERLRPKADRQSDFFRCVDSYLMSRRKMLFVYGEEDTIPRAEFHERFPDIEAGRVSTSDYVVVPEADHNFTRVAATEGVIARTTEWLARHYRA